MNKKLGRQLRVQRAPSNGDGHTIKGLKVTEGYNESYVGLFAWSNSAIANNLTFKDPVITGGNNL